MNDRQVPSKCHGALGRMIEPLFGRGSWAPWERFKWIPVAGAVVWAAFVWVQIILKPQGDFPNHWKLSRRLVDGTFIYEGNLNFVYPPFWAVAHTPLTFFGPHTAQILAYPLAIVAVAVLVWSLRRLSEKSMSLALDAEFWAVAAALFLASPFLSRDLAEIGVNTALVALSWFAVYLWAKERDMLAGCSLGFAAALKCTPLLFVAWFALKRQWTMVGASLLFLVVFTLSPILFMGPQGYVRAMHHWVDGVVGGLADPDPSHGPLGEEKVENFSLRPALARYLMNLPYGHLGRPETSDDTTIRPHAPQNPLYLQFLDLSPATAGIVVRLVMAVLLLWMSWQFRHGFSSRQAPEVVWEGAVVSLLILLFSPITWLQHGVGVIPALYLICRASFSGWTLSRWMVAFMGGYTLLLVVLNRELIGKDLTKILNSYRVKTAAFLMLLAIAVALGRQIRQLKEIKLPGQRD